MVKSGEHPTDIWIPQYPIKVTQDGCVRDSLAPVNDLQHDECPMSAILRLPEMDALVTEIMNMQRVKEISGAVPYGLDCAEWPSRWYDAVRIAKIEEDRAEIAKDEAREKR